MYVIWTRSNFAMQRIAGSPDSDLHARHKLLLMEAAVPTHIVATRSFWMDTSSDASAMHRPGRGRIFDSIVDAFGDTPIIRLRNLPAAHGVRATILAKLEY